MPRLYARGLIWTAVQRFIHRFGREGVAGLRDRKPPGKPPVRQKKDAPD
jgi:hypothetical protein